jgi:hypothetical protein
MRYLKKISMKKTIITACVCILVLALVAFNSGRSNKKASAYMIMYSEDVGNLERAVNQQLSLGWTLTGGVAYANGRYCQAMSQ